MSTMSNSKIAVGVVVPVQERANDAANALRSYRRRPKNLPNSGEQILRLVELVVKLMDRLGIGDDEAMKMIRWRRRRPTKTILRLDESILEMIRSYRNPNLPNKEQQHV